MCFACGWVPSVTVPSSWTRTGGTLSSIPAVGTELNLVWALESLDGRVVNPIRVDVQVAAQARVALDQMLALPGETSKD